MKSVLNTMVSLYSSCLDTENGINVNLLDLLQDGSSYEEQCHIASLKDSNEALYKSKKTRSKAFTPSARDAKIRKVGASFTHTCLIQLDFDQKDNPNIKDWELERDKIFSEKHIAYCGLSFSGKGIWALVSIKFPEKHLDHYRYLQIYYKSKGLVIDKQCGNVQRLRICSYDPNGRYRHDPLMLEKYYIPRLQTRYKINFNLSNNSRFNDNRMFDFYFRQIIETRTDIAPDYASYLALSYSIYNTFGADGEDIFVKICSFYSNFAKEDSIKHYKSISRNSKGKHTVGTFYHLCHKAGIRIKAELTG